MTSTPHSSAPFGTPLFSTAQVREIETANANIDLMRRAGKAAAEFLFARTTRDSRVVLFVGPGNNGGDALACATELAEAAYAPLVVLLGDPEQFSEDAARAWQRMVELHDQAVASGSAVHPSGSAGQIALMHKVPAKLNADWIVDGLFGIGLKRPLAGRYVEAVQAIAGARKAGAQVLALDLPSGVDGDTGAVLGGMAVVADHTISFLAIAPGLVTGPGLDRVGRLTSETLGLTATPVGAPVACALHREYIDATRKRATANAHKGTHGTCAIVGGASGMLGAVLLASRAAARSGAGKVKLGWLADPAPQVDPLSPEVMMATAAAVVTGTWDSMVIGCGLGVSGKAARLLRVALKRELPLVVDADALNLIAKSPALAAMVAARPAPIVITPHPAEAARLLDCSTATVQADRLRAARQLATMYHCICVLKGAGTVVDDGATTTINCTGNPLLATAGSGDVLAGIIGALLAQGYDAATAARLGVCMHGAAADDLASRGVRRAVASDILEPLMYL